VHTWQTRIGRTLQPRNWGLKSRRGPCLRLMRIGWNGIADRDTARLI
jgi:hypothetical protein